MPKYPKVNYIGNKEKLLQWIIQEFPIREGKVLDLFAGGCSVSYGLKKAGYSVIANDSLYMDYVIGKALVENEEATVSEMVFETEPKAARVEEVKEKLSFLKEKLYYAEEVEELARLIVISETLDGYEKYLFLALLRRAMIRKLPYSRMNVPWNQIQLLRDEEYSYKKYKRKRAYHNQTFESHMRENLQAYNDAVFAAKECHVYHMDALDMARQIGEVDAVYMDPPYPGTMNNYDAFYGMFDDIFEERKMHMDFTQKEIFLQNLEELIVLLKDKTNYIILSQNSRVKPSPNEIEEMLKKYGTVVVKEKKHNYQVTGKENKNASKELLFILTC